MTLREVITEKRKELWRDFDLTEMGEAQELIIDRIDGRDDRMCDLEDENVNLDSRIDKLENRIFNLEQFKLAADIIKSAPDPKPQELFPGYNELIKEAIPVFKAAIAKKKLELDQSPMTESEVIKRNGLDLSAAHDFTGPGEYPEE